ncbi:hypothetical protein B7494_g8560 [Chlorociboria aeruginascens]|nr:hypothetical protein B7494_g8560 [Chlorociboria aeruginascens]
MADHSCPSTHSTDLKHDHSACLPLRTEPKPHPLKNIGAPNAPYFTPQQVIPSGTAILPPSTEPPILFQPLTLRSLHLQNRILVSPMCQYSAQDGHLSDWHLTHLGGIIQRGPSLTLTEATAVTPEGRITPEDSGLWKDSQIAPLKRIVDFAHSQNQYIGVQLAHAGRKASTVAPWIDRKAAAPVEAGGWPDRVLSASSSPYDDHTCIPKTMTLDNISHIKESFISAVHRALVAGFDAIEIHAAHGYLLHSSYTSVTNMLPHPYSGSFENRIRLLLEITTLIRNTIPSTMPLLVRISGTDWVPPPINAPSSPLENPTWNVEQCIALSLALAPLGVDLIDVSTGGLLPGQKIPNSPGYQVEFSSAVKKALVEAGHENVRVGAVGLITTGKLAQGILENGDADVVFVGRHFLRNPGLVWDWAAELGVDVRAANQIGWGFGQRAGKGVGGK